MVGTTIIVMIVLLSNTILNSFKLCTIRRAFHRFNGKNQNNFYESNESFETEETCTTMYDIDITEPHQYTISTAIKHCQTVESYLKNKFLSNHTIIAYNETTKFIDNFYSDRKDSHFKYVILDSGCGKGMSTIQLAKKYPNMPVIGIDKSIYRLSKNKAFKGNSTENDMDKDEFKQISCPKNCLLLRAELIDFWILSLNSDWIIHSHFLLYPNPYPKSKHLKRRWHGHPCFPIILILGGYLELRSNWNIYCQEMHMSIAESFNSNAIKGIACENLEISLIDPKTEPSTHFERKYKSANVKLYKLSVNLGLRNFKDRQKVLLLNKN